MMDSAQEKDNSNICWERKHNRAGKREKGEGMARGKAKKIWNIQSERDNEMMFRHE